MRYMKSWAFHCIKHKEFGNWKIKIALCVVCGLEESVTVTYQSVFWVALERIGG